MVKSVFHRVSKTQTTEFEAREVADAGFTLIELMVVLLIIAILLAIAIPTFLGVTSSANDRATQSNLTNGLTEAGTAYQAANQAYTGVQALLIASAPEFTWTAPGLNCIASQPNCISVGAYDVATAGDAQGVILAAMSKTGTCWWVAHLQTAPVLTIGNTGFEYNTYVSPLGVGMEVNTATPPVNLTTAGTYYAKQVKATPAHCDAAYPPATGFIWGSSFSTAGVN
jgi:type IV pilus assembly protein PilA